MDGSHSKITSLLWIAWYWTKQRFLELDPLKNAKTGWTMMTLSDEGYALCRNMIINPQTRAKTTVQNPKPNLMLRCCNKLQTTTNGSIGQNHTTDGGCQQELEQSLNHEHSAVERIHMNPPEFESNQCPKEYDSNDSILNYISIYSVQNIIKTPKIKTTATGKFSPSQPSWYAWPWCFGCLSQMGWPSRTKLNGKCLWSQNFVATPCFFLWALHWIHTFGVFWAVSSRKSCLISQAAPSARANTVFHRVSIGSHQQSSAHSSTPPSRVIWRKQPQNGCGKQSHVLLLFHIYVTCFFHRSYMFLICSLCFLCVSSCLVQMFPNERTHAHLAAASWGARWWRAPWRLARCSESSSHPP